MQNGRNDLSDRLLDFAAEIIKLVTQIEKSATGQHISKQLMRSGTSAGANYEEACGAESRADFIHKLQISLKELRESVYWLRLIEKTELILSDYPSFPALLQEAGELTNIVAKSIVTARKN